jgi:hypothetical protein
MFHTTVGSPDAALVIMSEYVRTMLTAQQEPNPGIIFEISNLPQSYPEDPVQSGMLGIINNQLHNARRYRCGEPGRLGTMMRTMTTTAVPCISVQAVYG